MSEIERFMRHVQNQRVPPSAADRVPEQEAVMMVERVAKAVGESLYGYADPVDTPQNWARSMAVARAAIAAMREPTEAMLDAGDNEDDCDLGHTSATRHWRAMIDAALNESQRS